MKHKKQIIGWKESIDLTDWNILGLIAKADTGARRSAIDVRNIHAAGEGLVSFDVVLHRKKRDFVQTGTCPIAHQTAVRSSNGHTHLRYFVQTTIQIGTVRKVIELSLVDRKHMTCRMLLGRKALEPEILVDPSKRYLIRPRSKTLIDSNNSEHT